MYQRDLWIGTAFLCASSWWASCGSQPEEPKTPQEALRFEIVTLSRAAGVPDSARRAFEESRGILERLSREGRAMTFHEETIGLEGERRLRVEFADLDLGRSTLERIRDLAGKAEMMRVQELARDAPPFPK